MGVHVLTDYNIYIYRCSLVYLLAWNIIILEGCADNTINIRQTTVKGKAVQMLASLALNDRRSRTFVIIPGNGVLNPLQNKYISALLPYYRLSADAVQQLLIPIDAP